MKSKKEVAIELYEQSYEPDSIAKLLKISQSSVNKWIAEYNLKNAKVKAKTSLITDVKYHAVKDIPDMIKGLTLAGYSKEQVAMVLNIELEDLEKLIENVDEIFEKYMYAKFVVNKIVTESYLGAILPGMKVERHFGFNYPKDENGNITDVSQGEKYLIRIIEKDDRGDVMGMIKWMEANMPDLWKKDKTDAERLNNYGVADLSGDEDQDKWEERASEHQDLQKAKVRIEMKAEDE